MCILLSCFYLAVVDSDTFFILTKINITPIHLFYSMFILVEGASKERAFQVGKEIAAAVTADNPKPVKLKFEKVRILYKSCWVFSSIVISIHVLKAYLLLYFFGPK